MAGESQSQHRSGKPNRLIHDKNPYLLQHAYNPVDWYPWGEEAFQRAKTEDKPVFLSIGYSTCHWCHVMAHESFEDPEVAGLMNDAFVSIKVDREERPDIDSVYMSVCQMMTGSGGWPLTIIMTPDKKPFFAATYIPKYSRYGRIGLMELIPRIKTVWDSRRDEVSKSAEQVIQALERSTDHPPGEALTSGTLKVAYEQLARRFDPRHAGFGSAPKFPTPHNLLFLLRYWKRTGVGMALDMVEKTLTAMRWGGIYDHVGFGFHRYSTDEKWLLPHFEKMLYDQALLSLAYTEAYQATGKEEYADTAKEIFFYVLRDMTDPEGGFYSAEDADSEGEEGKFYVWTESELGNILPEEDVKIAARVYGVNKDGNFSEEATGKSTGANILHLRSPLASIAQGLGMSERNLRSRMETIREKLFFHRERRVHPHKDDKILTDWNGLMIAALAKGARVLGEARYADAAARSAEFILTEMKRPDGRLLHRYRDGHAGVDAMVDDYAFLIWGLLELYETTFEVSYLRAAMSLNDDLTEQFWDEEGDGFFSTADDGERVLVRQKEVYDGAVPSGNSVAMLNLFRLGRITGKADLEDRAERIGRVFSNMVGQAPSAFTQLMVALEFGIHLGYEVVIAGDAQGEDTRSMVKELRRHYVPNKVVLLRPTGEDPEISAIAEYTLYQTSKNGKATAYVCQNYACKLPTTDAKEMMSLLGVN